MSSTQEVSKNVEENLPRVFRMHFVPSIKDEATGKEIPRNSKLYDESRSELFKFFTNKDHSIIGTGWADCPIKEDMSDIEIEDIVKKHYPNKHSQPSMKRMFKALCSAKPGDLVWMTHGSHMQLFRITKNCIGREKEEPWFASNEDYLERMDIGHFFCGEWIENIRTSLAPGVVLNNLGIGPTFVQVTQAPKLSCYRWNEDHPGTYQVAKLNKKDLWDQLTNRQVEGLVLSYIQRKYDCILLSETLKHSTKDYECILAAKDGTRYYPQVKTGNPSKPSIKKVMKSLKEAIKDDLKERTCAGKAIVFFENEEYAQCGNAITISKEDLLSFATKNKKYLAENVIAAFEACAFTFED